MQYAHSDLKHLVPLWERKLTDSMGQPVPDRIVGGYVNVFGPSVRKDGLGDVGTLAQDRFSASIIRQSTLKVALK